MKERETHKCFNYPHSYLDDCWVMWIDEKWQLCIETGTDEIGIDVYIPVDYCPFCGEKLDE